MIDLYVNRVQNSITCKTLAPTEITTDTPQAPQAPQMYNVSDSNNKV